MTIKKEDLPVLSVKYKIPSPRSNYIRRDKLLRRLEEMGQKAVTIVKAGAGSGKSTLLSIFIKERNLSHVSWITLDKGQDQAFLFWQSVFGALESELKTCTQSLRHCFEDSIQREMLEQMLTAFAGQLDRETEIYLILDDFHWITDAYLLETLNSFIRMMPENLHLVLLSRQTPQIDLGNLYMKDRLLLLNEEEMRLSKEECRQFLTQTLGRQQRLDSIIENANGWIGGAQLMAITDRGGSTVHKAFSSADEKVIYDYIEKEIFADLSEEERQFLLKTAVLSYLNEDICRRYLPEYHFSYMIKSVSDKNLFVILIDEEKREYRYHGILREFLRHKLEQDPQQKQKLHRRAAETVYDLQDYDECVRLLFESRDYELLMQRLMEMPQNAATFSYMMQVPREEIIKNPDFAYQYFFCYYAALEAEECEKIYDYIKSHLSDDATYQGFKHANLFLDVSWAFSNIAVLSYAQIDAMPLNQVSKAYLLIKEAYFLFLADQISDAISYLDRAECIYRETGNIYIEVFIMAEKTQILEENGDFNQALALYEKMKNVLRQVPSMESSYYIGIAGLHIRQLQIAAAEKELAAAKAAMNCHVDTLNSAYLYTLAEWYYVSGMPEKTEELITALAKDEAYQSVFFAARLLRYPAYRGKNEQLARSFVQDYERAEAAAKNMDTELLYAGITYEFYDQAKAAALLDSLTARARKAGNKVKIIECTLMRARWLYEEKREGQRIVNLIAEAVTYACQECIRLPFWFEKPFLTAFLGLRRKDMEAVLSEKQFQFLQEILAGCVESETGSPLPFGLTEREWEVLQEISGGKSNKEIAEKLCISLSTVKTHLINIYGKLGVNNRLSAVNKIKELERG